MATVYTEVLFDGAMPNPGGTLFTVPLQKTVVVRDIECLAVAEAAPAEAWLLITTQPGDLFTQGGILLPVVLADTATGPFSMRWEGRQAWTAGNVVVAKQSGHLGGTIRITGYVLTGPPA